MNFLSLFAILFALLAVAVARPDCRPKFTEQIKNGKNLCLTDRPVHGTCPAGSEYNLGLNKCVYTPHA